MSASGQRQPCSKELRSRCHRVSKSLSRRVAATSPHRIARAAAPYRQLNLTRYRTDVGSIQAGGTGSATLARKLFISYSHHDADLLGELRVHLRPLERAGIIAPWFDGYLVPGDDFDREVRAALAASDFIGLLVTPRFLASDYCVEVEMEDAVRRHQAGQARVVPIIAKPCQWKQTFLSKLLATPKDAKPISQWPDADDAWNNVAHDLSIAAQTGGKTTSTVSAKPTEQSRLAPAPSGSAPFTVTSTRPPTDQEVDDFLVTAFETVASQFEASLAALSEGLSGRYRRLDANRFTATIYKGGAKAAGCTIYTGGAFGSRGIVYNGQDSGETNTMSDQLSPEVREGQLGFKLWMGSMTNRSPALLTAGEGAEHLWHVFTSRIR